ncbi:polyadenylate-binding protein-like [Temnothorax nylanderi]|uniref:polyadenylate-binding protein-like n=1 Tax=Temnothorax nylanderi TaxID=102681 RepID=UPI003A8BCC4D
MFCMYIRLLFPRARYSTAVAMNSGALNNLGTSLYVLNLHVDITEMMLDKIFSTVGPVRLTKVFRDKNTNSSLGYAYVGFKCWSDAELAIDIINFCIINGRPIQIMRYKDFPTLSKFDDKNVSITNLDKKIDHQALYDTFSAFGKIVTCKVEKSESKGTSKGYVHFETKEAANKSIKEINKMLRSGRKVYIGKFIPHKERRKDLEEKADVSLFPNFHFDEDMTDKLNYVRDDYKPQNADQECQVLAAQLGIYRDIMFAERNTDLQAVRGVRRSRFRTSFRRLEGLHVRSEQSLFHLRGWRKPLTGSHLGPGAAHIVDRSAITKANAKRISRRLQGDMYHALDSYKWASVFPYSGPVDLSIKRGTMVH